MAIVSTSTFQDRFETADARWNANYGGVSLAAGRARVPCAHLAGVPQYAGFQSVSPGGGDTWTIASSQVYAELVTVPVASGATSAWCQLAVLSATSGTYLSILYDSVSGLLALTSRVGFSDPGAVYLTYVPGTHRWLRIRHNAGAVDWDTSSDGLTWATRRTLSPAPAWVSTDAVGILIDCARDGGTNDYAEWDNVNITPVTPTTVTGVAAVGAPAMSLGTTTSPTTAVASAAVGAPAMSLGTTVLPARPMATTTVGSPVMVLTPLPALCGTATVATITGSAAQHTLSGTATVEGSCLP